jgi:hypothetical protein
MKFQRLLSLSAESSIARQPADFTVNSDTTTNRGKHTGGRGGIRTHGTLAGTPVFKTGALNHSATLPLLQDQALGGAKIKNDREQKWLWPQRALRPHETGCR